MTYGMSRITYLELKRRPEMLTARETVERHAQAAIEGKTDVAMADIAPEAMSSLGAFAEKMGPVQPKGYEILGEAEDGEHKVFRVKYSHETGSVTVESTWALKGESMEGHQGDRPLAHLSNSNSISGVIAGGRALGLIEQHSSVELGHR